MKREFSAGGIVYQKVKSQKSKVKSDLLWLVCQHSHHKGWVFPKGLIGDHKKGESSVDTAVREVEEETGVKAKIITKLPKPATYFYVWDKEKRFKTVIYYLMEYVSEDEKKKDKEMSAVEWLDEGEMKIRLSYKSDKFAFEEALKLFNNNSNAPIA